VHAVAQAELLLRAGEVRLDRRLGDWGLGGDLAAPIATGIVLGRRWRLGAAAWFCAAMVWLVTDWAMNHEDVAFHAVVGVICAALVALGAGIARVARTFDHRQQSSA
jgi:hypothetical protein